MLPWRAQSDCPSETESAVLPVVLTMSYFARWTLCKSWWSQICYQTGKEQPQSGIRFTCNVSANTKYNRMLSVGRTSWYLF